MRTTIEEKHNEKLKSFEVSGKQLNDLKNKLTKITEELGKEKSWVKRFEMESQRDCLQKQVDNASARDDYLLDVVPIIGEYMMTDTSEIVTNGEGECKYDGINIHSVVEKTSFGYRGQLYDKYMEVTESVPVVPEKSNTYTCKNCGENMLMNQSEAVMICNCGYTETYFDMNIQGMTYEQEITSEVNVSFSYKRINHFNEWLAQFQAKESTDIPQDLLNMLINEFKKARTMKASDITPKKVKEFLKKLGYNKYYEHTTHITNLLNGQKPPTISPHMEEKLRNMFRRIQVPFEKHKPPSRSNFLSYSYCLYKFCELLGEDELMTQFPLLKSREKLYQQDCIWKKICADLNWEYAPTV